MVRIQAQTMRVATPQRTAERRWVLPTPTMADGYARERGAEEGDGSGGLGAESADGLELGDLGAHGVNDAPATEVGAERDGGVSGKDDGPVPVPPVGGEIGLGHDAGGVEGAGDDAHGFLSVVAAVSETIGGRRHQLKLAK